MFLILYTSRKKLSLVIEKMIDVENGKAFVILFSCPSFEYLGDSIPLFFFC